MHRWKKKSCPHKACTSLHLHEKFQKDPMKNWLHKTLPKIPNFHKGNNCPSRVKLGKTSTCVQNRVHLLSKWTAGGDYVEQQVRFLRDIETFYFILSVRITLQCAQSSQSAHSNHGTCTLPAAYSLLPFRKSPKCYSWSSTGLIFYHATKRKEREATNDKTGLSRWTCAQRCVGPQLVQNPLNFDEEDMWPAR